MDTKKTNDLDQDKRSRKIYGELNFFMNKSNKKSPSTELKDFISSDRGGIQTPNPQSRNLMRYSVAPRGRNML